MGGGRRFSLRISRSLKKEVARLAQADGVSINTWIHAAIARRVGGGVTAEAFFKRLRDSSHPSAMLTLLKQSQED